MQRHGAFVNAKAPGTFSKVFEEALATALVRETPRPGEGSRLSAGSFRESRAESTMRSHTKPGASEEHEEALRRLESKRSPDERGEEDGADAKKDAKLHERRPNDDDMLDPSARHVAQLAPPALLVVTPHEELRPTTVSPRSMEELVPALVKRIAWAGDKHRGSVRLELGAGAYDGTTLVVHADDGKVRIEVSGHGADLDRFRKRLGERLRDHGIEVESIA